MNLDEYLNSNCDGCDNCKHKALSIKVSPCLECDTFSNWVDESLGSIKVQDRILVAEQLSLINIY